MIKLNGLTDKEIKEISQLATDSFMNYEMTGDNLGMLEHLDREHFYYLTRSYFELAVRNGTLYCAGDIHEGYFIFGTPKTRMSLSGSLLQAKWMLSAFGPKKGIQDIKEIINSGTYLASEFKKAKMLFNKIEIIAVCREDGRKHADHKNQQNTNEGLFHDQLLL